MGFGNLRFAEIKSCPSTYPTCDLRKAEICNKNFWIGNDPPPRLELFQKFIRFGGVMLPLLTHWLEVSIDLIDVTLVYVDVFWRFD